MNKTTLIRRSLAYHWRINLAVVFGMATAVAVLAGALVVGDSVRESLRDLVLLRLGRADHAVLSTGFFREQLADELRSQDRFTATFDAVCPLILLEGFVTDQNSGRRASKVKVYGIDDRFWRFHGHTTTAAPGAAGALVSEALAEELGAKAGESILVRVEKASAIPADSLHGRKEDIGRTIRLSISRVLGAPDLGEFSLRPEQGAIRAVFVGLRRLQTLLEQQDKVNAVLVSEPTSGRLAVDADARSVLERLLRDTARFDDLGLKLRVLEDRDSLSLESDSGLIGDAVASAARTAATRLGMTAMPMLTYLANAIRFEGRQVPYSVVTAVDLRAIAPLDVVPSSSGEAPIVMNSWAAGDLGVRPGDSVSLEYYLWEPEGRLLTRTARFRVAGVIPIKGAAADPDLAPRYPGITDSNRVADWDPPFPIDLRRIRKIDEDYWHQYRTTPKAFIPLETGRELWQTRYGSLTSLRILAGGDRPLSEARDAYGTALRKALDPLAMGFSVYDVRAQGLAASRGATDFSAYFTYFSVFLVFSALLLAALFFKLGIEQRLREIGLLQAVGFDGSAIRTLFFGEALVLSILGSLLGVAGAVGYGGLIMLGLRTWWVDAVGTTALTLHLTPLSLLFGALGGIVAALGCIWWTLRSLSSASARSLLTGAWLGSSPMLSPGRRRTPLGLSPLAASIACGFAGLLLLMAAANDWVSRVFGFFGAGTLFLAALLFYLASWFTRTPSRVLAGHGWLPVSRLGLRNAAYRPGRSLLCVALIAAATFIIVAVEAFKRDDRQVLQDRQSGTGGYPLLVESLLPIVHDLNSREGRDALNLPAGDELEGVTFSRFRVRPGDDASCLNLYQPRNARILAPPADFVRAGRFTFQSSLAETGAERADPWLLLNRRLPDGAIPVVADANSMTYVLHLELGNDIVLPGAVDRPVRLRLVGALSDSIFQGELLMSEANFSRLFPDQEGYRFFLVDAAPGSTTAVADLLETRLADFGVDVSPAAERLAGFHRVESTYLSTFQTLGGLGLVLGTFGLGAVLLRNVLERRRELALLRALGYNQSHFFVMVIAENALLLACGLAVGTACALLAIAPAFLERGDRLPAVSLGLLLCGVLVGGLAASLGATAAALRSPLLPALRAE